MKINKEEIEKLAFLARIKLSVKEIEIYESQFSSALELLSRLDDLNIATPDILGISNRGQEQLREDKEIACPEEERLLSLDQAFDKEGDQIKVNRVL